MSIGETCVIQVTNIAPSATKEQMSTLFGFIGHIKEICLYPNDDTPVHVSSKVCYIRYAEPWSVGVAQHLTNTVFVDRALIVLPVNDGKIPDEASAMTLTNSGIGGINSGVVSQMVTGIGGTQMITTIDPKLTALNLSQYPPLPANMDPTKIEEIRRTVYVGNLDSSISAEQLLKFFNQIGEVKYVRMAGEESQPTRFAFIEFTDQSSVANALQYSGVVFGGRPIKINHSNNAIVKPQVKNSEAVQKEIEEAMKRVREAQSLISAAIEPGYFDKILDTNERKRSRSRSRSRRKTRSRSRDRRRRSRSRSRERRRSGSRSRDRRRSRSPKKRSRSKERRRSRSRSRDRRHRRRSRSRERRNRRSRSRERTSRRRSRTRSHSRSRRDERERSKEKERLRERLKTEIESQPEGPQLPPEEIENKDIDEVEVKKESSSPLKYRDSPISPRRSISPRSRKIRSPRRSRSRERRRRRDRSRSRERHSKEKKRKRRDRDGSDERESKEGSWIKRDYDEEEKGYDSGSDSRRLRRSPLSPDD